MKCKRLSIFLIIVSLICMTPVFAGYYQDAFKEYKAKNYAEAVKILKEGLEAAPNDEQLAMLLGQCYFRLKDFDKAIEAFRKAISLAPEMPNAHYMLGISYTLKRENGKLKPAWFEASQAFAEAVKLNPDNFRYQYNLGHSLLELKKYNQAIEALEKAYKTEKGSKDYKTATDLGIAYQLTGNKEKAIELFEKAHQLNPKKYQPLMYLGNLYMEMEKYDKVRDIGERLIKLDPQKSKGYIFRGAAELRLKKFASAKEAFKKAIELNPKDASAYYHLGLAQEGMKTKNSGSYQDLIESYGRAVSLQGSNASPEWHYRLGHAYELEAQLDWDRAIRRAQARSRCLKNLRKAKAEYQKAGSHAGAQRQLSIVNEKIRQLEVIQ